MPLMFSDVFFLSCTRPPLQGFGGVFFSAGGLFMHVAELVFWWVLCFVFCLPRGQETGIGRECTTRASQNLPHVNVALHGELVVLTIVN